MQGFNMGRYVPPEHEGTTSANKLAGKHALGSRARKASSGILTVRFEMPFAIWCTTCPPPHTLIGQGVRFNAEKKKVGTYYSTPIYSFRMKHTVCGGVIEIRTDPQNTAYVVTEGARKRDTGEDKELGEGEIRIGVGDPGLEKEREDAFVALEGKVEDKRRAATEKGRIEELMKRQERDWEDPYERSRKLRRAFRVERKERKLGEERTEGLKEKMSLGIELVEENEEDRVRAKYIEFGDGKVEARVKPFLRDERQKGADGVKGKGKRGKIRSAADVEAERKAKLREELSGNTRAAMNPFQGGDKIWTPGFKRRKPETAGSSEPAPALVDYDSD